MHRFVHLPIWVSVSGIIGIVLAVAVLSSVLLGRAMAPGGTDCHGAQAQMQGSSHSQSQTRSAMPSGCPDPGSPAPHASGDHTGQGGQGH